MQEYWGLKPSHIYGAMFFWEKEALYLKSTNAYAEENQRFFFYYFPMTYNLRLVLKFWSSLFFNQYLSQQDKKHQLL